MVSAQIYTHCDFDGAASAALVSYATGIDNFQFATPDNIRQRGLSGKDIVCDLPYISGCHLWFDHHASNIQEVEDRGLNLQNLPGHAEIAPSAAHVILSYYSPDIDFPPFLQELAAAANIIDSMDFPSLKDWLAPTPANIINETININSESYPAMCHHLNWLTSELVKKDLQSLADSKRIKERYSQKLNARERELAFIQKIHKFAAQDENRQILILDCSELSFPPKFNKTLALKVQPEASYILLIASDFRFGKKTNNLKISLSKNFLKPSDKKLGKFLEELQIGGGHDNAAGGIIKAKSKKVRTRKLQDFINQLQRYINE